MLTLSVIAFASCSNDDNILEPQERITAEVNDSVLQIVQQNLELSKLQSNINSYNFNYIEKQNPNTRSIKNFFLRIFLGSHGNLLQPLLQMPLEVYSVVLQEALLHQAL